MFDLTFASQIARANAQLSDALTAMRPPQAPPSPTPTALLPPQQQPPQQPQGALAAGNPALGPMSPLPPSGGPLMARPQNAMQLGMGRMSMSPQAPFQVNPQRQAPQQFAKGGAVKFAVGGAWTRKEGKNPEGGLNAKGRASLKAQGHDIKPPVSAKQAAKSPKAAARRKSFCSRMSGMPGPMKDEKGRPTRKALSLNKWDC